MERPAKLDVEAFLRKVQGMMEEKLREVARTVNGAPDGSWINASEMEVRDLFGQMRREAYETALQMRLEAAEGSFSPGGPIEREASVK